MAESLAHRWGQIIGESFEVQVRFNTGAKIDAAFPERDEAIVFLRSFA